MTKQPKQQPETAAQQSDFHYVDGVLQEHPYPLNEPLTSSAPMPEPPPVTFGFVAIGEAARLMAGTKYPSDDLTSKTRRILLAKQYLAALLDATQSDQSDQPDGFKARNNYTNSQTNQPNENSVIATNDLYSFALEQYGLVLQGQPAATKQAPTIDGQEPHPATNSRETAVQQPPEEIRKRSALIKDVESFWPSIERDLRDASRKSSGLGKVAKSDKHGFWKVYEAITWATQRGKITKEKGQAFVSCNPESVLSPMLRALLKLD